METSKPIGSSTYLFIIKIILFLRLRGMKAVGLQSLWPLFGTKCKLILNPFVETLQPDWHYYLHIIKKILTWNEGCWVAEFMAADVASKGSVFNLVISSLAQLARCFLLFTTDSTTPDTLSLLSNWWQFSGGGGGPEI